jgi:hypothetical protein
MNLNTSSSNFLFEHIVFYIFKIGKFNPPKEPRVLRRYPNLRKTVIKYNLEEYSGINVQMKVIGLEFFILSTQLNSPMLS